MKGLVLQLMKFLYSIITEWELKGYTDEEQRI